MTYINSLDTYNGKIGKVGEDFACKYLESIGHEIMDRNFRNKVGEIDIVTKTVDKLGKVKVHILEVKTSKSINVRAEENMHRSKILKVAKMAEIYMKGYCDSLYCIDFVGVNLNSDDSLKNIVYLENLEI